MLLVVVMKFAATADLPTIPITEFWKAGYYRGHPMPKDVLLATELLLNVSKKAFGKGRSNGT